MANNLNTDKRKCVLKEYWKSQNAETIRTAVLNQGSVKGYKFPTIKTNFFMLFFKMVH